MKLIAYAVFVVTVLMISGFARAQGLQIVPIAEPARNQVPVRVVGVQVDASQTKLLVTAELPTPCYDLPTAALIADAYDPRVLWLHVNSLEPADKCIQPITDTNVIIDLRQLVRAARISIDARQRYVIKFKNYEFKMPLEGAQLRAP